MVDVLDSLKVVLRQEEQHYRTSDYIWRMQQQVKAAREAEEEQRRQREQEQWAQMVEAAIEKDPSPAACATRSPLRRMRTDENDLQPSPPKKTKTTAQQHSIGVPNRQDENCSSMAASPASLSSTTTTSSLSSSCASSRPTQANAAGSSSGSVATSRSINIHWRETMCNWAYTVVDHFKLSREMVTIAVSHLDRYLSNCPTPVDKTFFQLLVMTCLYLSIKLNESRCLIIGDCRSTMEAILMLSKGAFTLQEMERLEYDVLQRLHWHVHPPTPQLFIEHFMYYMPGVTSNVQSFALFLIELSTMDYFFVLYKPSEIAYAAMLVALDGIPEYYGTTLPDLSSLHPSLHPYSSRIRTCYQRLATIHAQAENQADPCSEEAYASAPVAAAQFAQQQRTHSPPCVMKEAMMSYQEQCQQQQQQQQHTHCNK